MFTCQHCNKTFKREREKNRHLEYCEALNHNDQVRWRCEKCEKFFTRKDNLNRHISICNQRGKKRCGSKEAGDMMNDSPPLPLKKKRIMQRCEVCDCDVENYHSHLKSLQHKDKICDWHEENIELVKTSFKSRIATYRVRSNNHILTAEDFLKNVKERVLQLITCKQTEVQGAVKVNVELFASYVKQTGDDMSEITSIKSFNTRNKIISLGDNLNETFDSFLGEITAKADEFQERDSGWAIQQVLYLEVNINKFSPLKGSSFIQLPKWIRDKHACVNVKNADQACFFWAVTSAMYPANNNINITSSYPHYKTVLNVEGIESPVSLKGIKQFEQQNDISVNVYEVCNKKISGPLYYTEKKQDKHVNLLYLECGERSHYAWIKDMSRLIRSQLTKHETKLWLCDGCLLTFGNEDLYLEHCKRDCAQIRTTLPIPGRNTLKFKNYQKQMRVPVIIYADFESLLIPLDNCLPSSESSFTRDYQLHEPYSFGYYIKCSYDDSLSKYVTYRGESCAATFMNSLEENLKPFAEAIHTEVPMLPLTQNESEAFLSTVNCHICQKELGQDRVRDHCHITGKFRGAAHSNCNLNYKIKKMIPIVIHNLSKYDAHFIVKVMEDYDACIIPKNKENFISFTVKSSKLKLDLRFIDSYRFLASSLDKLASNLNPLQFETIQKYFPEHTRHLLMRKGVFPYDYIDSLDKLNRTSLPPQQCFYNKLNKRGISDKEYSHAQQVWSVFNIRTLGEYSDLYLKTDVLLLTDIFENFRNVCFKTYDLDPAHFYTAPGLSWEAMLKYTGIELELLSDISKIKFISRGIRGGLSQCSGKYSEANNKYMKQYDEKKESKYILYLDANNQYGWAMSQYLPQKGFRWLSEKEIEKLDVTSISESDKKGYFLEVDLEYPKHIHEMHNDYPFCPENRLPEYESSKTPKLIAGLNDKERYVIHYVNLKQALKHGLKLKKIHRVIEYIQSPWLRRYIDLNTKMRTAATSPFEKDFYKLMNNAVFGKTMENVDKRVDVRLVNNWDSYGKRLGARALISRLNFHSSTIINENLTIIQMRRSCVKYDKPIYVGFTVLELSKTLMYDFHYDYMKPKYGENLTLLYTDTDSFIYEIRTDDFYKDVKADVEARFDTSEFLENNRFNLPLVNKKVVGKFKDECANVIVKEFIGIRSKCYFIKKEDESEVKKIKGIKRNVVSDEISEQNYLDCLNNNSKLFRTMNVIRSRAHTIFSQTLNKIALSNFDDKRFMIPNDNHKTLAWGHKDIEKYYFV